MHISTHHHYQQQLTQHRCIHPSHALGSVIKIEAQDRR